jgi:Holliday junction resolvase-like predicted endonuclease
MPAKNIYHNTVKNALIKEGWTITDDPLFIQFGEVDMYIDIGAERIIAAEKENQKIAIEIKSFLETHGFHPTAIKLRKFKKIYCL